MINAFEGVNVALFPRQHFELDVVDIASIMLDEITEKDKINVNHNLLKFQLDQFEENDNINERKKDELNSQPKIHEIFPKLNRDQATRLALELDEFSEETIFFTGDDQHYRTDDDIEIDDLNLY
jgi:hypothetical protein